MKLRYRTGAKKDGRLTGVDGKILIDGGAYSSFGLVTTYDSGRAKQTNCQIPASPRVRGVLGRVECCPEPPRDGRQGVIRAGRA